jgi:hypothetical protein
MIGIAHPPSPRPKVGQDLVMLHVLLGLGLIVAVFAASYPIYRHTRHQMVEHHDAMQAWATSQGYTFAEMDDDQIKGWSFHPFGQGDYPHARRVITGQYAGHDFAVYDYSYMTTGGGPSGTSPTESRFAMIAMQLSATVPWLHVNEKTKHLLPHRGGTVIATGDEAFDHVYEMFGEDAEYAKAAVSATVRAALPAQHFTGLHIVASTLFVWQHRVQHDPALLPDRLRATADIAVNLPAGPT